jgi:hypothetical protein
MPEPNTARKLLFMSGTELEPYARLAYEAYQVELGVFRRWQGLSSDQKAIWRNVVRAVLVPWRMKNDPQLNTESDAEA